MAVTHYFIEANEKVYKVCNCIPGIQWFCAVSDMIGSQLPSTYAMSSHSPFRPFIVSVPRRPRRCVLRLDSTFLQSSSRRKHAAHNRLCPFPFCSARSIHLLSLHLICTGQRASGQDVRRLVWHRDRHRYASPLAGQVAAGGAFRLVESSTIKPEKPFNERNLFLRFTVQSEALARSLTERLLALKALPVLRCNRRGAVGGGGVKEG